MTQFLLYYALATLVLVLIDRIRIRFATAQKKQNIRKWISWSLSILAAMPCAYWADFPALFPMTMAAIGVRYTLYDPALNLSRGLKWNYVSKTTNSITDRAERGIRFPFWLERVAGIILTALAATL